jgi:hypothetical protein
MRNLTIRIFHHETSEVLYSDLDEGISSITIRSSVTILRFGWNRAGQGLSRPPSGRLAPNRVTKKLPKKTRRRYGRASRCFRGLASSSDRVDEGRF